MTKTVQALPLGGGISSGIYRVDLRSGSYCVKQALPQFKVAKEWTVPVERVFSEIDYLRTVGADCARLRAARAWRRTMRRKSFVMEFLGPEFRNWKAQLLGRRSRCADSESRWASCSAESIRQPPAAPELADRFATDDNFYAIRLEPYLVETSRVHPQLRRRAPRAGHCARPRRGACSCTATSARRTSSLGPNGPVFLDAECAWFGDPAFDLAFCLNHFLLKAAHLPTHAPDP